MGKGTSLVVSLLLLAHWDILTLCRGEDIIEKMYIAIHPAIAFVLSPIVLNHVVTKEDN